MMVASQQGDQEVYRDLLAELGEVIEAYLRRRFGPAPFVEDCVQESLLGVHGARHTYDPSRPFRPWMFAIVRHKTVDCLRRVERYEVALDRDADSESQPCTDHRGPDPGALAGDAANQALGCLRRLDRRHCQALTLTKLEGYTVAEAASLAGVSESAMKLRVHRGLKKLRQLLEAHDDPLP